MRTAKERTAEYLKQWRAANPEKHRTKINETHKRWRATNREKFSAIQKRSRKANWPRYLATAAARRARKRLLTVGDLTAIAMVYARCQELRQWFDVSVDHVVPLAKGGTHEAGNLQIIYAFENSLKQDKLNYKPRVIFK
jgi:hypothetical protein